MDEFADAPFKPRIANDGASVEIDFGGTMLSLTTEQLQVVLLWLGLLRSKMHPPVPRQPERQSTVFATEWQFPAAPSGQPGSLCVRTGEFGWVVLTLPADAREVLARALRGQQVTVSKNVPLN